MVGRYNIKNYLELCYLVINKRASVQSFIDFFSLSSYEYNADFLKIKDIEGDYGLQFNIDKEFISYEVIDEVLFEEKRRSFWSFFHFHRYTYDIARETLLQQYISKVLLWSENYVNIDDLADNIGYSRSNLRIPLKKARNHLEENNIIIKSVPHYGLKTIGIEFHKRRVLIVIYNMLDVRIIPTDEENEFLKEFQHSNYGKLSNIIVNLLKKYKFIISPISKKRINYYLIIQNARIKKQMNISESELNQFDLNEIFTWNNSIKRIAREMLAVIENEMGYGPYNDNEINSLVLILLECNINPDLSLGIATTKFEDELQRLKSIFQNEIEKKYGIAIFHSLIDKAVFSEISNLVIKNHLNSLSERASRIEGLPTRVYQYPIMLSICRCIAKRIGNHYNYRVPYSQIARIVDLIAIYIECMDYTFPKLKIAITSRSSSFEPDVVLAYFKKEVNPKYYDTLECIYYDDFENLIDSNPFNYDLVLCDQKMNSHAHFLSYGESLEQISYYVQMSRNLCAGILTNDNIYSAEIKLWQDNEKENLASSISRMTGIAKEEIDLAIVNSLTFDNNIIVILVPGTGQTKNHLQVGKVIPEAKNTENILYYIALIVNFNEKNIRFCNTLLHELVYDRAFMVELCANPTINTINNQLNPLFR